METNSRRIRMADLVRSTIVSADGTKLGRVVDVRLASGPPYRVLGLDFGGAAWLYRFHMLEPLTGLFGVRLDVRHVPWEAVDRYDQLTVYLKPEYTPDRTQESAD